MKLFLARHSFAGKRLSDPALDKKRGLAPEGQSMASAMAEYMYGMDICPRVVYCSTYTRSVETAALLAEPGNVKVVPTPMLDPDGEFLAFLWDLIDNREKKAMIVGHSDYLQSILGGTIEPFAMCEVRCYSVSAKSENWPLKFKILPSDVGYDNRL